ncbi:YqzE family protein [Fervidibacillus halotolerans]|uniref:YqzE family protein n=1 Tax=Fervidibacillus halotolerans TaxID=2980027 RepID=A0A9E8LXA7_9BACI|nr:YqzE family protein [Fervidibacillus halotolerans]WAA11443.1 YqzE family protein [Fervidibacillus halotolerans]
MKSNEYVKFLTETLVSHLDKPKEERKRMKLEKKERDQRLYKWFGIMPYAMKEEFQIIKRKIRRK